MKIQFANLFAQLTDKAAAAQPSSGRDVIELADFEIASIGGGEAITNVY